jgi:FMN-dependent NADH-azoreductase
VAGQTFRYGPGGPEGLAGAKRVIVALSRGNFYGPGAPAEAFEHVETYLRVVFGFIGVTKLEFIIAEGVQVAPEDREKAMTNALKTAGELQAA